MREEYTSDTYPSFGKTLNNEPAVISLTSWKKRIGTCSKTIFSLLRNCPNFHIVLVLSEEEFPKMMDELPEDIKLLVENKLIELMFVYYNYRSFKKVLFTMDKYRTVPVISADDDCIYTCNYAKILYNVWKRHKDYCITFYKETIFDFPFTGGYGTLHPPYCYKDSIKKIHFNEIDCLEDDMLYTVLRKIHNLKKCISLNKPAKSILFFHDEIYPLHDLRKNVNINDRFFKIKRAIR